MPVDKPVVVVSVRNWKDMDKFIGQFAALCDTIVEKYGRTIVFLGMQMPNDSLVGDQRRGHRPDSEHLSDGRLQQDKAVPVTDGWGAIETYNLVNVILDPLLQLRARTGWVLPGCISPGGARA